MGELAVAKQADDDVVEAGRCVVHGESRLVAGGGHVVLVRGNADIEVRVVVEAEIDVLNLEPRLRGAVLRPEADDDSRSGTGDCLPGIPTSLQRWSELFRSLTLQFYLSAHLTK